MKKLDAIIFVDVDEGDVPAYDYRGLHFVAAKQLGLFCITIINEARGNKDRVLSDSDEIVCVKDINFDHVFGAVIELQTRYNVRTLFCHAGHVSSYGEIGVVVADIATRLSLRYSNADAITTCNNKFLMRYRLKQHKVRTVDSALCNSPVDIRENAGLLGFPLIAKPVFGASSAFTKKCNNLDELIKLYNDYTKNYAHSRMVNFYGVESNIKFSSDLHYQYIPGKSILLEQFIEGVEATVECVIYNGEVHPVLLNEKLVSEHKRSTILENLLISPSVSFDKEQIEQIKHYARECLCAVGLKNDIVHFEFIMHETGPIVIEVNPRLGGLYVNSAFKDIAGVDPYKLYLLMLLGDAEVEDIIQSSIRKVADCKEFYSMMVIYPEKSGKFIGFNGLDFILQNSKFHEYGTYPINNYVNADIEENYLLKAWACVDSKEDALNLYQQIVENIIPVFDNN
jgi:biotin carboxylase